MKIRPIRAIAIFVFLIGVTNFSLAVHRAYVRTGHKQTGVQIAQLNLCLQQYIEDHGGTLPVAANSAAIVAKLAPYHVSAAEYRAYYDTNVEIKFNCAISGLNAHKIASPGSAVTFYESQPDFEGKRWVTYLGIPASPPPSSDMADQYGRLINEQQWRALQKTIR